jgi:transposase InsO family protein
MNGLVEEVSREWPCLGYKKVTSILRDEHGQKINPKRVARVRRERGLMASRKGIKKRRVQPQQEPRRSASRANEVWSYDFISDATAEGRRVRILSVIDEYTRECVALRGGRSFPARKVIEVLEEVIECTGRSPENLRSDNGPEFVARVVRRWVANEGIRACYIEPGAPWENGHVESFHAQLRAELLNRELYLSMEEVSTSLEEWREKYNFKRPHGSLGNLPPSVAAKRELALRPPACAPIHAGNLTQTK